MKRITTKRCVSNIISHTITIYTKQIKEFTGCITNIFNNWKNET